MTTLVTLSLVELTKRTTCSRPRWVVAVALSLAVLFAGCASTKSPTISTPVAKINPTAQATTFMAPTPMNRTPTAVVTAQPNHSNSTSLTATPSVANMPPTTVNATSPVPTVAGPQPTGYGPLLIPIRLQIPKIKVNAAVETVGLEPDGTMGTPNNFEDVGWYGYGPIPGNSGTSVIAGHVDSVHGPAVFWYLKNLVPGDLIKITFVGGATRSFVVDGNGAYETDAAPIPTIFSWSGPPRLTLITCGGVFDRTVHAYNLRVIVYAHLEASSSSNQAAAALPNASGTPANARVPAQGIAMAANSTSSLGPTPSEDRPKGAT